MGGSAINMIDTGITFIIQAEPTAAAILIAVNELVGTVKMSKKPNKV